MSRPIKLLCRALLIFYGIGVLIPALWFGAWPMAAQTCADLPVVFWPFVYFAVTIMGTIYSVALVWVTTLGPWTWGRIE